MPELLSNPSILILIISSIALLILYLREYHRRKRLESQGEKIIEDFKQKGLTTLQDSMHKSEDLIAQAEQEKIKILASAHSDVEKIEDRYTNDLKTLIIHSDEIIKQTQNELLSFLQKVQSQAEQLEKFSQQETEARINQIFGKMEDRLSDFLVSTEQKTLQSIDLEVKSARELIENYKNQQLKLIDENILAIMEQTLSIVLGKSLPLNDQLDLIYESLNKAKTDKFII